MTARLPLKIGTRGSILALKQAEEVRAGLVSAWPELRQPDALEIVAIRTTGDRVTDRALTEIGGKGLFAKEIEERLLAGAIDLAVHSLKDMPTWLPSGLVIDCTLAREDPRDALISNGPRRIADLPPGAVVGSSSPRRQALLLAGRPDLRIVNLRGNVDTRLRKIAAGEAEATLLAMAGLNRLGLAERATAVLEPAEFLPAAAQGVIGIEVREDDELVRRFLQPLHDHATGLAAAAERAVLESLDGSCRTPIAAYARTDGNGAIALDALVARLDGSRVLRTARMGPPSDAVALGRDAGDELKRSAGPQFFD